VAREAADVSALFSRNCKACHGADGRGSLARASFPDIPDFTDGRWQARRADSRLAASILDGVGSDMPSHRGKVSDRQARGLVDHVRGFVPDFKASGKGQQTGLAIASFHERIRRLQEQQDELHRQYRELSQVSRGEAQPRPSESAQLDTASEAAQAAESSAPAGELFRTRCVKCHGADGTGSRQRERLPEIPDFTNAVWQTHRADRELLKSILDGKGSDMPPQRGKIGEEQGRILVSYVRALCPSLTKFKRAGSGERDRARPQAQMVRAADCREVFLKQCAKCHGADGKGTKVRDSSPDIPDFTKAEWQAQRTDEQLERSILDGKGSDMPAHRGRINEDSVRGLVGRVRDFAAASGKSMRARSASAEQVANAGELRVNDESSSRVLGK
jgi:mono/diheme cytochrome c family protein